MAKRKDPEYEPEERADSEAEILGGGGLPAGEEDQGMGAIEPVFEEGEVPPLGESAPELEPVLEGGMGALEPILRDEDLGPAPGLPSVEMAIPEETSTRGAPLFSPSAFLAPDLLEGIPGAEAPALSQERDAREELVALLVGDEQLKALWERANQAKLTIDENVNSVQIGRTLLDQIKFFR